jgi:hypothetical protein
MFVSTHEKNNVTMFRDILRSEGWPRLVYLSSTCRCSIRWTMLLTCVPLPRCAPEFSRANRISAGLASIELLLNDNKQEMPPWWPHCDSLRLYGFGGDECIRTIPLLVKWFDT